MKMCKLNLDNFDYFFQVFFMTYSSNLVVNLYLILWLSYRLFRLLDLHFQPSNENKGKMKIGIEDNLQILRTIQKEVLKNDDIEIKLHLVSKRTRSISLSTKGKLRFIIYYGLSVVKNSLTEWVVH